MEKKLLFSRKFNGETYKFYLNKGIGCLGIYSEYVSLTALPDTRSRQVPKDLIYQQPNHDRGHG